MEKTPYYFLPLTTEQKVMLDTRNSYRTNYTWQMSHPLSFKPMIAPIKIKNGLFLGNIYVATDPIILKHNNIHCVVTIINNASGLRSIVEENQETHTYEWHYLDMNDNIKQKINTDDFMWAVNIIKSHIDRGHNVLVHCYAGMNRSVSMITAYIIYTSNLTLDTIIECLMRKRGICLTNEQFRNDLVRFFCYCRNMKFNLSDNEFDIIKYGIPINESFV